MPKSWASWALGKLHCWAADKGGLTDSVNLNARNCHGGDYQPAPLLSLEKIAEVLWPEIERAASVGTPAGIMFLTAERRKLMHQFPAY